MIKLIWRECGPIDRAFVYFVIAIIIFIIGVAISCAVNAYNETWTIDNGKFKWVYNNRTDCIHRNTLTEEECNDDSKVVYKNTEEQEKLESDK